MKRWLELLLALLILTTGAALSSAAPVFQFRDNFSNYPPDSDGSPTWFSFAAGWEVREGKFLSSGDAPGSQSALLQAAPFGTRLTVEATLSITRMTNDTWKIAGVVLYADKDNFWHCALVEAPETQGKRHYIELSEMLDGQWLAHVKLRATSGFGGDFNWQYNHPYRMRLALTPETITGSVSELEGTGVYDFTYAFDKSKVLKHGKPGLDCSGFEGAFDDVDVRVEEAAAVETRRPTFPAYQVQAGNSFRSKPTGFFRTEQRSGVWWLIDPKGFPFYVVGTDHCNYYAHGCEKLGYAPYHKNCETKFGSEEAWAVSATDRLKSWNFNTVAAGHIPSTQHRGLAHIPILGLGQSFARVDDICKPVNWTGFPNVFNPKWQRSCDKQALALCGPTKDDPWLIGYFIDNELEWWGKDGRQGLLGEVFQKPPDHSSKQALIEFFRKRYTGITAFNSAWKTNLKDFEALRSFA
ncbi:MAG: hypothetical protein HY318_07150, partial [Armatimonadetes bacterium]|nr:hypothetical protein [Armatimonadota bacterium]